MAQNLLDILPEARKKFQDILDTLVNVPASEIGVDHRAYHVWVDVDNSQIISSHVREIEYYGGFEYVPTENKVSFMEYTIYMGEGCERVMDAIKFYERTILN